MGPFLTLARAPGLVQGGGDAMGWWKGDETAEEGLGRGDCCPKEGLHFRAAWTSPEMSGFGLDGLGCCGTGTVPAEEDQLVVMWTCSADPVLAG